VQRIPSIFQSSTSANWTSCQNVLDVLDAAISIVEGDNESNFALSSRITPPTASDKTHDDAETPPRQ
jgi:hypothetical protein